MSKMKNFCACRFENPFYSVYLDEYKILVSIYIYLLNVHDMENFVK